MNATSKIQILSEIWRAVWLSSRPRCLVQRPSGVELSGDELSGVELSGAELKTILRRFALFSSKMAFFKRAWQKVKMLSCP